MSDYLILDSELAVYQDPNYSSIIFAPLPEPNNLPQAINNLAKHIEWAGDKFNDLRGQHNSLIHGSKIISQWKEVKNYLPNLNKILINDDKSKIYNNMLKLALKKDN